MSEVDNDMVLSMKFTPPSDWAYYGEWVRTVKNIKYTWGLDLSSDHVDAQLFRKPIDQFTPVATVRQLYKMSSHRPTIGKACVAALRSRVMGCKKSVQHVGGKALEEAYDAWNEEDTTFDEGNYGLADYGDQEVTEQGQTQQRRESGIGTTLSEMSIEDPFTLSAPANVPNAASGTNVSPDPTPVDPAPIDRAPVDRAPVDRAPVEAIPRAGKDISMGEAATTVDTTASPQEFEPETADFLDFDPIVEGIGSPTAFDDNLPFDDDPTLVDPGFDHEPSDKTPATKNESAPSFVEWLFDPQRCTKNKMSRFKQQLKEHGSKWTSSKAQLAEFYRVFERETRKYENVVMVAAMKMSQSIYDASKGVLDPSQEPTAKDVGEILKEIHPRYDVVTTQTPHSESEDERATTKPYVPKHVSEHSQKSYLVLYGFRDLEFAQVVDDMMLKLQLSLEGLFAHNRRSHFVRRNELDYATQVFTGLDKSDAFLRYMHSHLDVKMAVVATTPLDEYTSPWGGDRPEHALCGYLRKGLPTGGRYEGLGEWTDHEVYDSRNIDCVVTAFMFLWIGFNCDLNIEKEYAVRGHTMSRLFALLRLIEHDFDLCDSIMRILKMDYYQWALELYDNGQKFPFFFDQKEKFGWDVSIPLLVWDVLGALARHLRVSVTPGYFCTECSTCTMGRREFVIVLESGSSDPASLSDMVIDYFHIGPVDPHLSPEKCIKGHDYAFGDIKVHGSLPELLFVMPPNIQKTTPERCTFTYCGDLGLRAATYRWLGTICENELGPRVYWRGADASHILEYDPTVDSGVRVIDTGGMDQDERIPVDCRGCIHLVVLERVYLVGPSRSVALAFEKYPLRSAGQDP